MATDEATLNVCPFCRMLTGKTPRARMWRKLGPSLVAFEPLGPVTPGHLLVVPRLHCTPAGAPSMVGLACQYAATLAADEGHAAYNLIVSNGFDASQTVRHLHVHLIPRRSHDRLALPWGRVQSGSERIG